MSLTKALMSGAAITLIGAVASRATGLASAPILTRLLGPEPYGTVALLSTLVGLGGTLALFGRELGYARYGLQGDAETKARVEVYLWRSIIVSAVGFALAISFFWIWFQKGDNAISRSLGAYLALAILLSPTLSLALVRSRLRGQYVRAAVASFVAAIVGAAVSIGWALFVSTDAWALAAGLLTVPLVNLAILGMPSPLLLAQRSGLDRRRQREVLMLGISSVVTAPIYWALMSLDRWFLFASTDSGEVGAYAFAAQFGLLGVLVNSSLTATWIPEAGRAFEAEGLNALPSIAANCTRLIIALLIVWMGVSAIGGDMTRLLAPTSFHHGAVAIPWIAAGVFFYGIGWLFVASLFIRARMRFMTAAWILGGAVGVTLYAAFAPRFGLLGVAIAQATAFGVIALATWIASVRILAFPLPYLRLALGSTVALGSVCVLSPQWLSDPMQSLMAKAPVGALAAALVVALISPELLSTVSKRLGRRLQRIGRDT